MLFRKEIKKREGCNFVSLFLFEGIEKYKFVNKKKRDYGF